MKWFEHLQHLLRKEERVIVGAISGTSVDAIDVGICTIRGAGDSSRAEPAQVSLQHFYSHAYPQALREEVQKAHSANARRIAELHAALGKEFAKAIRDAAGDWGKGIDEVDLIGSHGQTVYHHSCVKDAPLATLQLGDGDFIACETGRLVISDFRQSDIALGGEGAPLTPYADTILFGRESSLGQVVLNLGGISNVTVLHPNSDQVIGFDCGPANAPLDRLAVMMTDGAQKFDKDGEIARSGTVNDQVLAELLSEDEYLKRKPPKSTGFEMYGDEFVTKAAELHGKVDADLMATLVEFVAVSITRALEHHVETPVKQVIVAGGGGKNPLLLERLSELLDPITVVLSEALGVPSHARETMAFAVMANDALFGLSTNLPSVTGASRAAALGKLSFPLLQQ